MLYTIHREEHKLRFQTFCPHFSLILSFFHLKFLFLWHRDSKATIWGCFAAEFSICLELWKLKWRQIVTIEFGIKKNIIWIINCIQVSSVISLYIRHNCQQLEKLDYFLTVYLIDCKFIIKTRRTNIRVKRRNILAVLKSRFYGIFTVDN